MKGNFHVRFLENRGINLSRLLDTLLIEELLQSGDEVNLFPRPRRFGKTLNLSMLRYFFEKSEKNNAHLFENTQIWNKQEYRDLQGTKPVIFLSLKECKLSNWQACYKSIIDKIAFEFERHAATLLPTLSKSDATKYTKILDTTADVGTYGMSLQLLSRVLCQYYDTAPLILIDEYDTPIHASYLNNYYKELLEFLRHFLTAGLKDNEYVFRAVLTGILRTGKEGIFSGLNNIQIFSLFDNEFSDKFGFTTAEVEQLFKDFALETKIESAKAWYNGYHCGTNTLLYNPWSIASCVKKNGLLRAYWANTSDNELLKKIIPMLNSQEKNSLEDLLKHLPIEKNIDEAVIFPGLEKNASAVWSLLLFSGYLTFSSCKRDKTTFLCSLEIPNKEVRLVYEKLIIDLLSESTVSTETVQSLIKAFNTLDTEKVTNILASYVIKSMSSFDIGGEPEKNYHLFLLGRLVLLDGIYEVRSNRESGDGRYDILLIPTDKTKKGIILEFKKARKEALETAAEKALRQISDKRYNQELKTLGINEAVAWSIAFHGKHLGVKAEVLK